MPATQLFSLQTTPKIEHYLKYMYRRRQSQIHQAYSLAYGQSNRPSGSTQADATIVEMFQKRPERQSLRRTVLTYEDPLEPVAEDEWEALG